MVWLGIDLGNARVGLALSNPEHTFAHPVGNINVRKDYFEAFDEVLNVIEDEHVECVVIGLPLQMDGTEGRSAKKARRWSQSLIHKLELEYDDEESGITWKPDVMLVDERLTTVEAHRQLFDAQMNSRCHRSVVDQQSAVTILQMALDRA